MYRTVYSGGYYTDVHALDFDYRYKNSIIAERFSVRQLNLLHFSFCVCLYVCMYVCPSRLGMLIFCKRCVLKVQCAHATTLLLLAGLSAQVLEYDRSICTTRMMDNTSYQG